MNDSNERYWLCVYCGSRDGVDPRFRAAAEGLGTALAAAGFGLVYGGARVGLMGAVADAALAGGAPVHGVIPRGLSDRELAHHGLTRLDVVETMHQRKMAMIEAADAFVAMPGGFGTLEELFEVVTWGQIGWHEKPVGLLDVAGFYQPLVTCMRHMRDQGFVAETHVERIVVEAEPTPLVETLFSRVAVR
ncbi:TIGR00730 family Rossman fold protein [Salinisphaera sp. Q1T1-3]|uniref:LOG family protein n=1 Tax=Salinisphaera sp. Q1T1-3 TaxID=2321229 RepID=UPI000E7155AB|nr:TIGR00730 family Rossman fold protein [Salinisphaera sp. Q1T1-3]RJS91085.1 TIGR00730 family Rossman fold protein [Salinisphaera sp. Q1T1-3]